MIQATDIVVMCFIDSGDTCDRGNVNMHVLVSACHCIAWVNLIDGVRGLLIAETWICGILVSGSGETWVYGYGWWLVHNKCLLAACVWHSSMESSENE